MSNSSAWDKQEDSTDEEDENDFAEKECPLCLDELDIMDQHFKPCQCGYQMCRFCFNQLKENNTHRCPACRTPYNPNNYTFTPPDAAQLLRHEQEKKRKNKNQKKSEIQNRKNLANVRVIQRNLVYVTNISLNYAKEETLRKFEYFSQYGKIIKVVINKNNLYSVNSPSGPSVSAYITFARSEDAQACIQAVDNAWLDGRVLRASFGTTKYCTYFLRNEPCKNPECLYLHELGTETDSFTKDEMAIGKHHFYEAVHAEPLDVPGEGSDYSNFTVVLPARGTISALQNRTSATSPTEGFSQRAIFENVNNKEYRRVNNGNYNTREGLSHSTSSLPSQLNGENFNHDTLEENLLNRNIDLNSSAPIPIKPLNSALPKTAAWASSNSEAQILSKSFDENEKNWNDDNGLTHGMKKMRFNGEQTDFPELGQTDSGQKFDYNQSVWNTGSEAKGDPLFDGNPQSPLLSQSPVDVHDIPAGSPSSWASYFPVPIGNGDSVIQNGRGTRESRVPSDGDYNWVESAQGLVDLIVSEEKMNFSSSLPINTNNSKILNSSNSLPGRSPLDPSPLRSSLLDNSPARNNSRFGFAQKQQAKQQQMMNGMLSESPSTHADFRALFPGVHISFSEEAQQQQQQQLQQQQQQQQQNDSNDDRAGAYSPLFNSPVWGSVGSKGSSPAVTSSPMNFEAYKTNFQQQDFNDPAIINTGLAHDLKKWENNHTQDSNNSSYRPFNNTNAGNQQGIAPPPGFSNSSQMSANQNVYQQGTQQFNNIPYTTSQPQLVGSTQFRAYDPRRSRN